MGLFDNLFSCRKKTVQDDIVCPYCFKKFGNEYVHFRMPASQGVEPDEKYNEFIKPLMPGYAPQNLGKVVIPGNVQGEKTHQEFTDDEGVKHKVLTGFKPLGQSFTSEERLCPHCHNVLPISSGNGLCKVISVVGYTQVGKTFFINSLIGSLLQIHKKLPNVSGTFVTENMRTEYINVRNAIEGGRQDATDVKYIKPMIIQLRNVDTARTIIISFYDFPGESNVEQIQQYSRDQILRSDALLVLFDLTQTETFGRSYIKSLIKDEERKANELMINLNWQKESVDDFFKYLKDLRIDFSQLSMSVSLNSEIEAHEKEKQYLVNKLSQEESEVGREQIKTKLQKIDASIATKKEEMKRTQDLKDNVSKKYVELFGSEFTNESLTNLVKMDGINKHIYRLNEDMEYPDRTYNPKTGAYDIDKLPAADWLQARYANAVGANAQLDNRPVAIVGTKSDEVVNMISQGCCEDHPDIERLRTSTNILSKQYTTLNGKFNAAESDAMDAFTLNQLLVDDGNLKIAVRDRFTQGQFHYFAVSALGTRYVINEVTDDYGNTREVKMLDAHRVNPWRIDEPLLWLLYKLGVIE